MLVALASSGPRLRLERHAMGDAVTEARQRRVLADAREILGEQEESRLEGILRILLLLQDPPTDAIHHRSVALDDGLEDLRVAFADEPGDQFPVGSVAE